jgi:hypothetical protein
MTIALEQLADGSASDRNFQTLARLVVDTGGRSTGIRWGRVAADGSVLGGSGGFTVTKGATGLYTVNQAMSTAPIVLVSAGSTGGGYAVKVSPAPTTSGFGVVGFTTTTAANFDGEFHWIAIG